MLGLILTCLRPPPDPDPDPDPGPVPDPDLVPDLLLFYILDGLLLETREAKLLLTFGVATHCLNCVGVKLMKAI